MHVRVTEDGTDEYYIQRGDTEGRAGQFCCCAINGNGVACIFRTIPSYYRFEKLPDMPPKFEFKIFTLQVKEDTFYTRWVSAHSSGVAFVLVKLKRKMQVRACDGMLQVSTIYTKQ